LGGQARDVITVNVAFEVAGYLARLADLVTSNDGRGQSDVPHDSPTTYSPPPA
jgi:hypothetical protein